MLRNNDRKHIYTCLIYMYMWIFFIHTLNLRIWNLQLMKRATILVIQFIYDLNILFYLLMSSFKNVHTLSECWWCTFNPRTRKTKGGEFLNFETSGVYRASSRTARAAKRNPIKKQNCMGTMFSSVVRAVIWHKALDRHM